MIAVLIFLAKVLIVNSPLIVVCIRQAIITRKVTRQFEANKAEDDRLDAEYTARKLLREEKYSLTA